jgi:hypothetical protein
LVLLFKGFPGNQIPLDYTQAAASVRHGNFLISDQGFDLRPYGVAARALEYPCFCFLNSFSEPLADDWLSKLSHALRQPRVGIAGATGSWESMYSNAVAAAADSTGAALGTRLKTRLRVHLCRPFFEPFPNWHLRTNALLVTKEIILRCWPTQVRTKRGAYLFESGKNSLTRQVLASGLDVVVVGKDGRAYPKEAWAQSKTYRSGAQENLLVADTQTRLFEQADKAGKSRLARVAWGDSAPINAA